MEPCAELRIHQRVAEIRNVFRVRFVMIEDNQIASSLTELKSLRP